MTQLALDGARSGTTWRVVLERRDLPVFSVGKGGPREHRLPTKNTYFSVNPHTKRIISKGNVKRDLAKAMIAVSWEETGELPPKFRSAVTLSLVQYAPKMRRSGVARGLPMLDSDACLAAVRDAIQLAGIVEDDALIIRNVCETRYREGEPGLEIELRAL